MPQLVSPKDDEWLPGLFLRCDAVNGWNSRTTMAHLVRLGNQWVLLPIGKLVAGLVERDVILDASLCQHLSVGA